MTAIFVCPRMLLSLLSGLIMGAAVLFVLYRWVIPTAVQYHGGLALLWHDIIVERALDTLTRTSRPQVSSLNRCIVQSLVFTIVTIVLWFFQRPVMKGITTAFPFESFLSEMTVCVSSSFHSDFTHAPLLDCRNVFKSPQYKCCFSSNCLWHAFNCEHSIVVVWQTCPCKKL